MTRRAGGLFVSVAAVAALWPSLTFSAQSVPTDTATQSPAPLVIKVGVDLIQLDAAVTDKNGQPVRDLRPEDFTIEVDGKAQPVLNAMFFEGRAGGYAGTPAESSNAAVASSPDRTLVLMVDDLNASPESMYKAKRAMQKFAADWDFREARVGLLSTSDDSGTIKLSRSPELFDEALRGIRYNIRSGKGGTSTPDFMAQTPRDVTSAVAFTASNPALSRANFEQRVFSLLATINTLRSVPGRKAVVLVSEGFGLGWDRDQMGVVSPFDALFPETYGNVDAVLRMITEVANRASVVIYTIDPSGLQPGGVGAEVATAPSMAARRAAWFDRVGTQGTLIQLAEDTGGLSVYNRNDLKGGLNEVVNDQRAYYLIGFEPPKSAFVKSSGRPKFHDVRLKVNRPGLRVRTRAGFYGVTDEEVIQRAPLMTMPEH